MKKRIYCIILSVFLLGGCSLRICDPAIESDFPISFNKNVKRKRTREKKSKTNKCSGTTKRKA